MASCHRGGSFDVSVPERRDPPPPNPLLQIGTFLLRFAAHHCPVADILPTRLPATLGDRATRAGTRDAEGTKAGQFPRGLGDALVRRL